MKGIVAKISFIILIGIIISACNAEKKVPEGKKRLAENKVIVNGKNFNTDEVHGQLYQESNTSILGFKFMLNLYNLANQNTDSTYWVRYMKKPEKYNRRKKTLSAKQVTRLGKSFWYYGIHKFLMSGSEPPTILEDYKTKSSVVRLDRYYFNNGYFDVQTTSKTDSIKPKRAKVTYTVTTGDVYKIDTVKTTIKSPVLDSLYKASTGKHFLKAGNVYKTKDLEAEKDLITEMFRNNGAYTFDGKHITFDLDTIYKRNKVSVNLKIGDYIYQKGDSVVIEPFKLYRISEVQVFVDIDIDLKDNKDNKDIDSVTHNNVKIYNQDIREYNPKAITDGVFIAKGDLYSAEKTVLTSKYLSNLKVFKYPLIQYFEDKRDSTGQSLIAKIDLKSHNKYNLGTSVDVEHSNIQVIGIALGVTNSFRNVFRGAENLDLSLRGNIGSSKQMSNPNNVFFNVSELGADLKLNIPRIMFPVKTERIIPKRMFPATNIVVGFSKQTNIGLDKNSATGIFSYEWIPRTRTKVRFDILNIQFVNNLNPENYYYVYGSSYNALNSIAAVYNTNPDYLDSSGNLIIESGTQGFTNDVLTGKTTLTPNDYDYRRVEDIEQQKIRITENNFIMAASFNFYKTTQKNSKDNSFYQFRTKVESAGNVLSLIAKTTSVDKNANGNYEFFGLEYSEYVKTELDFIKHWDLRRDNVFAVRTFFGLAVPYGNSNFIPFSRSYYAGGSNDNRAWTPYSLGPGSTASGNDFNDANLKIAFNAELRFNIAGGVKGAVFGDAGNIWNVWNHVQDEKSTFDGLKDLSELAIGVGIGIRYDLEFFVIRLDWGLKTYNPANEIGKRWFTDFYYEKSVINFGINYPF